MPKRYTRDVIAQTVVNMQKNGKSFNVFTKRDYTSIRVGKKIIAYSRGRDEKDVLPNYAGVGINQANQSKVEKIYNTIPDSELPNDSLEDKKVHLFSDVKRACTQYLKERDWKIDKIPNLMGGHFKNTELWNMMPIGERFHYVDLKHAYWQYANKLGYITDTLYAKALADDYKKFRNKALACLVSRKDCIYYKDGERLNSIQEWNDPYRAIYENIRFSVYNDLMAIRQEIGDDNVLWIKIDCIAFLPHCYEQVFKMLSAKKIKYRNKKGIKIMKDFYYFEKDYKPHGF